MTTNIGDDTTTWLFDLDGCRVDSLTGTSLRPGARVILPQLRDLSHSVLMWSAGGADDAERRTTALGVDGPFHSFHDKEARDATGRYGTDQFLGNRRRVIFIDDHPEDLPMDADVIAVRPYLAPNPDDRGLLPVAVRADIDWASIRP